MKWYCYVYYDENWQATYVGKGTGTRFYQSQRDKRKLPEPHHVQLFAFNDEWQSIECEIELISFWKRRCDGGCLHNDSTGGPGRTGCVRSASERKKTSNAIKALWDSPDYRERIIAARTGKPHTEERKRRHSERMKQWWAERKAKQISEEDL